MNINMDDGRYICTYSIVANNILHVHPYDYCDSRGGGGLI